MLPMLGELAMRLMLSEFAVISKVDSRIMTFFEEQIFEFNFYFKKTIFSSNHA